MPPMYDNITTGLLLTCCSLEHLFTLNSREQVFEKLMQGVKPHNQIYLLEEYMVSSNFFETLNMVKIRGHEGIFFCVGNGVGEGVMGR